MTAEPPNVPASPVRLASAPLGGFVAGVFTSQVVNNAMHLLQPLVIADLSGSLALAAFVASGETGVHMLGTLVSGGAVDRLGSRRALMLATAGRGAALSLVPLAYLNGGLSLPFAMCAYTLDAFVRGFVDSSVHALPQGLAAGDRAELDRLNAAYEFTFDLASVIGPLALGALLLGKQGVLAHAAIPLGFFAAAYLYSRVPSERVGPAPKRSAPKWLDWEGWRQVGRDPRLLLPVAGLGLFNLFPLRKVWSAFFAKSILGQAAAVGWIGAAFGAGGVLGSLAYPALRRRLNLRGCVLLGAAGTAALAVGWVPGTLWPMLASAAAFGAANACAELALLGRLGELTPRGLFGRVTSVARVGTTSASVSLKGLMAAAFAVGFTPYGSFALVGAGLGVMALGQLAVAARLKPAAPPAA